MKRIENSKKEVMDKTTLAKNIARKVGLTIIDVYHIIDVCEEEIIGAVKKGKKVQLNGFLVFEAKDVEGKTMVSPLDKKEYIIPAKRSVEVRVGKMFKESIKDGYMPKASDDVSDKEPSGPKRAKKAS